MYEFYRKPMANPITIPAESAYLWSNKFVTLRQEALRILRNTYPLLPWETKTGHLSDFSLRMKISG